MAVRDILRMGHPILRKKSEPVGIHDVSSSKIQNLITDLSDTLEASGGIGLAARNFRWRAATTTEAAAEVVLL